jgi:uncharacterized membrane protein
MGYTEFFICKFVYIMCDVCWLHDWSEYNIFLRNVGELHGMTSQEIVPL